MNSFERGLWAEEKVLCYMKERGYHLLQQRFKTSFGEIDLIMISKTHLLFIEVKYRKVIGEGLYAFQRRQYLRMRQTAQSFLTEFSTLLTLDYRMDVAVVVGSGDIHYICNIGQSFQS